MDLKNLFAKAAERMRSEFEETREALTHSGLKGAANETVVIKFLEKHLSKNVGLTTGQIVDIHGSITKQLDIIIYDANYTPVLYENGNIRVVPVECVYAVIEVKAHLDTSELERAYENMKSVRALKKSAFIEDPHYPIKRSFTMYGNSYNVFPIMYFVFAFESIHPFRLLRTKIEWYIRDKAMPDQRIDNICILDKGLFFHVHETTGDMHLIPRTFQHMPRFFKSKEMSLLMFYSLLQELLAQSSMLPLRLTQYIGTSFEADPSDDEDKKVMLFG